MVIFRLHTATISYPKSLLFDNRGVRMIVGADKLGFFHRGMVIPRYVFHNDFQRSTFRQIGYGRFLQIGKAHVFQGQPPPTGTALQGVHIRHVEEGAFDVLKNTVFEM